MADKEVTTVQSVDRALVILDILKSHPEGLGVTELSHRLDVSKSTIHRLLSSLLKQGYVKQDAEHERYALGLTLIELGEVVSSQLDIRRIAAPYLTQLAGSTGETVHLVMMDNLEIVYIDKTEPDATIRMFSRIGKRAPMHCTGVGKAMLAFLPPDKIDAVLSERPMTRFTNQTITDPDDMKTHLEEIRRRGVAFDMEEHEEGITCAAAPLFNYKGEVVAGISIAGPIMRVDDAKLSVFAREVHHAAATISKALGL
ncbi:IclR family transcriptional regulator [Thalassobacillus sp. CUG 92003]|uniref:IclR family transcriptional regulator n=1 Tax=Thalassobacillus sp. CUG 92003 TaxID=2736641 RepID=UPI0015E76044